MIDRVEALMGRVLVIDEDALLREFMVELLEERGIAVSAAGNGLDGLAKVRAWEPDVVVMDYHLSRMGAEDLLRSKLDDPNARSIPVIVMSPELQRDEVIRIAKLGVKKFLTKPIRVDALLGAVGELLGTKFSADSSPCVLEAHVNDEIIFVEVARGLNRDKLRMLHFRLRELIRLYGLKTPKILVMIAGVEDDNLEYEKLNTLFHYLGQASGERPGNVCVLTSNPTVVGFLDENSPFRDIRVFSRLEEAMGALVGQRTAQYIDQRSNTPRTTLLQGSQSSRGETEIVSGRFQSEFASARGGTKQKTLAVVDDDAVIHELVSSAFEETDISIRRYHDGEEFLTDPSALSTDLVLLDLRMPKIDGFHVLSKLARADAAPPVIVLSAVNERESVIRAVKLGVRSYMIKPLKPDVLLQKAADVLGSNFS